MLWLAMHLPYLPLEALPGAADGPPRAVTELRAGREVVCCADVRARGAGVVPGLPLGAALALLPGLVAQPRRMHAEQAAQSALLGWAGQFSACVAAQGEAGVVLEAGASRALFGGFESLMTQVRAGLHTLGHDAGLALAPTPAAARLLARVRDGVILETPRALAQQLASLPLQALSGSVEADLVRALAGLGLRQLGELRRLPRGGLARRYGRALGAYLDRLYGACPDPVAAWQPPAQHRRRLELPAPVRRVEPLVFAVRRLLEELRGVLLAHGAAVPGLRLMLEHGGGRVTVVELLRIAPTAQVTHLLELLRERLARTPLPAPVEALVLCTEALVPAPAPPASLFADAVPAPQALGTLCERLRARLGEAAVSTPVVGADHRPERAGAADAVSGPVPAPPISALPPGPRPLWLLAHPRPLRVRGGTPRLDGALELLAGPERIHSGWWDGADVARDYYLARHPDGRRLWVYRDRRGWFLHGLFG